MKTERMLVLIAGLAVACALPTEPEEIPTPSDAAGAARLEHERDRVEEAAEPDIGPASDESDLEDFIAEQEQRNQDEAEDEGAR